MDATRCSESSRDREERLRCRRERERARAQPRRPNEGHIGYGSGENGTELDALYRALRGERELQCMHATSHDRLAAETGEEGRPGFSR